MSDKQDDLAAICDELERLDRKMTAAPWREWAQPSGVGCLWKDDLPTGSACIESTGTVFAFGVAVCAVPFGVHGDVDGIAFLRNNAARIASDLRRLIRVEEALRGVVAADDDPPNYSMHADSCRRGPGKCTCHMAVAHAALRGGR